MVKLTELGTSNRGEYERVLSVSDATTGLQAFIAVHSTLRGPALGSCRIRSYPSRRAALRDSLRLSQAGSRQAALAGLPFGGGACVVMAPASDQRSDWLLHALGLAIDRLDGDFLAARDSGMTARDMGVLRRVTTHVCGLPVPQPDACPAAYGTFLAIQAAVAHRFGSASLVDRRIAVQGLGRLGLTLCSYLAEAGAQLIVADINPEPVAQAVARYDATPVPADQILATEADVLSPNAFGDVICDASLPLIRAGIVVGGASNQLHSLRHGLALHRRGILYVPDYVANSGGLLDVALEGPGHDPKAVLRVCETIRHTTAGLLREADQLGLAPLELAERHAAEQMLPQHCNTYRFLHAMHVML